MPTDTAIAPRAARPSGLVVGMLFFFSLIAPSPVWPAVGVRGFMLLAGLLWLLVMHLLVSGRRVNGAVLGGLAALFATAVLPALHWGDLRLLLYPIFFVSSVLLAAQSNDAERDAYIDLASRFMLVLCIGAVLGFLISAVGLPPLGSFENTDGRDNFIFYTTFTNTFEDGFIRPSGFYDEPGAFSFFICMIAFLREATGKSRTMTLALLVLGLVTFSLTHMLFLLIYLLATAANFRHLVRFSIGFLVFAGVLVGVVGGDAIENKVLSRLIINDDGNLAGDTRSMLLLNAIAVLKDEDQAALMGADSSCTLDTGTCTERFGPMGENLLSPLAMQGLLLSWPYYLFLLLTLVAALRGRRGLMFFAVGLLFMQRPYLLNLGYSVLGVLAVVVYYRRSTPAPAALAALVVAPAP
jgi:hypothetical protein